MPKKTERQRPLTSIDDAQAGHKVLAKTSITDTDTTTNIQTDEQGTIQRSTTTTTTEKTNTVTLAAEKEPDYIKLYLSDIMYLCDIPQQYAAVMCCLLPRMTYASEKWGQVIVLNKLIREEICRELGWTSQQTLRNALSSLCKGKILNHVAQGTYVVNPWLFGKGSWKQVSSARINIDYTVGYGRTFATVINGIERNGQSDNQEQEEATPNDEAANGTDPA